jgi:hypothetical protein
MLLLLVVLWLVILLLLFWPTAPPPHHHPRVTPPSPLPLQPSPVVIAPSPSRPPPAPCAYPSPVAPPSPLFTPSPIYTPSPPYTPSPTYVPSPPYTPSPTYVPSPPIYTPSPPYTPSPTYVPSPPFTPSPDPPGPPGPDGIALVNVGTWALLTVYHTNDVVIGSDGRQYVAKSNNVNVDPVTCTAGACAQWQVGADQGGPGSTGLAGEPVHARARPVCFAVQLMSPPLGPPRQRRYCRRTGQPRRTRTDWTLWCVDCCVCFARVVHARVCVGPPGEAGIQGITGPPVRVFLPPGLLLLLLTVLR